jgi:hypothetical protein
MLSTPPIMIPLTRAHRPYPTRAHQFMRDAGESLALPFLPVSPLSPSLITPYPPIHVQICNTTQSNTLRRFG